MPIALRTPSGRRSTSMPATVAEPAVGSVSVVRILMVVDLPAPLGPSRPNTVPGATAKLSPLSAVTSPYSLTRPFASMAGPAPVVEAVGAAVAAPRWTFMFGLLCNENVRGRDRSRTRGPGLSWCVRLGRQVASRPARGVRSRLGVAAPAGAAFSQSILRGFTSARFQSASVGSSPVSWARRHRSMLSSVPSASWATKRSTKASSALRSACT